MSPESPNVLGRALLVRRPLKSGKEEEWQVIVTLEGDLARRLEALGVLKTGLRLAYDRMMRDGTVGREVTVDVSPEK